MANEFDTVSERDLGGLGAGRRIAAVRAVDDVGQSINATPEQIAALTGMDYSKLIEQEVQGEFVPDRNGVRKQVYVRTIVLNGTTSSSEGTPISTFVNIPGKGELVNVSGAMTVNEAQFLIGINYNNDRRRVNFDSIINADAFWYAVYSDVLNAPFHICAIVKYTKR